MTHNHPKQASIGLAFLITTSMLAQERAFTLPVTALPGSLPPATAPKATDVPAAVQSATSEPGAVGKFLTDHLPEAFTQGKFNLNARLRYEYVEQSNLPETSSAPTLRTRFGFTTAPLGGFTAMIEAENVTALGSQDSYNAAGANNQPDKPVVADPPTTEINQAWIAYSHTNAGTAKVGRQRITLDNQRFVGESSWRQNMQTFDAATAQFTALPNLNFFYGYVWEVNRVYGDVADLPANSPNHDFRSDSHLINLAYTPWTWGRFVSYAYLLDLDLENGTATTANSSSATYGGYFAGNTTVTTEFALNYRAELALQTDYGDSTLNYEALYYNLELSAAIPSVAFGAGYEVLGSDNNVGVKTPLATLHAFNGWADVFLTTPNAGLRDLYAFGQITLPASLPLRLTYHQYHAADGAGDFGKEFDVSLSKKFGKSWTALLKYCYYAGNDAAAPSLPVADTNVQKFWAQVEFNF